MFKKEQSILRKTELACHIIHSHLYEKKLSAKNAATIFYCFAFLQTFNRTIAETAFQNDGLIFKALAVVNKDLQMMTPKKINAFANRMIAFVLGVTDKKRWKICGNNLCDRANEFQIDLSEGVIRRNGESFVADEEALEGLFPLLKQLLPPDAEMIFSKENCVYTHVSGELKIIADNFTCIKRRFENSGKTAWFEHLSKEEHQHSYFSGLIAYCNKIGTYQYWIDEQNVMFAESTKEGCSFLYVKGHGLNAVKYVDNQWQMTGERVFTLADDQNLLPAEWNQYLKAYEEPKNIIVIVEDNAIKEIHFPRLKLSFQPHLENGSLCTLTSIEFPGLFLSKKKGLPQLNGFTGAIVLENKHGMPVQIFIPAFAFNKEEKSHSFNQEVSLNRSKLLTSAEAKELPLFSYAFDRAGDLIGTGSMSVAADLYLALIYRAQSSFIKAKAAIDRSHHHANNTQLEWTIASQIAMQPQISPQGAALDCHLALRMADHQDKWSSLSGQWNGDNKNPVFEVLKKQLKRYQICISTAREDVDIIPNELHLPPHSLPKLSSLCSTSDERSTSYFIPVLTNPEELVREQAFDDTIDRKQMQPRATFIRLFDGDNAHLYMKRHFVNFFEEIISEDPVVRNRCLLDLFFLSRCDSTLEATCPGNNLLAFLLFAHFNPGHFAKFTAVKTSSSCYRSLIAAAKKLRCENIDIGDFNDICPRPEKQKTLTVRSKPNALIKGPRVGFKVGEMRYAFDNIQPLANHLSNHFSIRYLPVTTSEFALEEKGLRNDDKLSRHLFKMYKKGHEKNKTTERPLYTLTGDLEQLRINISEQNEADKTLVNTLEKSLLDLVSETPLSSDIQKKQPHELADALLYEASRQGLQISPITIGDLTISLLQKSPDVLIRKNPFLTKQKVEQAYGLLMDFFIINSRISQSQEALDTIAGIKSSAELNDFAEQHLGAILAKTRDYDVVKYAEFLVYEYATGRLLRPQQVIVLIKLIDAIEAVDQDAIKHLLLQFAAGGGKTAVIIPILAQRFAAIGYMPVIINTPELYFAGIQEIPASLKASFNKLMEVIERGLDHVWTTNELKTLEKDLRQWHLSRKTLLLQAITWHSLNAAKRMKLAEGDFTFVDAANSVLSFFKKKCIKLEDESQQVSDPLQQAIRTYGKKHTIPEDQQRLFIHFYNILFGQLEGTQIVAQYASLEDERLKEIDVNELSFIQNELATRTLNHPLFKSLADEEKDGFLSYLLAPSKERPDWLVAMYSSKPEMANLMVAARAFIRTHLPHILTLQCEKDYGDSIHPNDLTIAPKHDGKGTPCQYGDYLLTLALTMQKTKKHGVPPEQFKHIIRSLQNDHARQKRWFPTSHRLTPAEELYLSLLPEKFQSIPLNAVTENFIAELSTNAKVLKNPRIIEKYVLEYAFPQIETPMYQVVSSPSDFQAGFDKSILFSATPGILETYPIELEKDGCHYENSFEAEVIEALLSAKNRVHCFLDKASSPKEFFQELKENYPEVFAQLNSLIDRGALLSTDAPVKAVDGYLELGDKVSALTFDEGDLIIKWKNKTLPDLKVTASQIDRELKKIGLKLETLMPFINFPVSRTTGTDIRQNPQAKAGLTIGKEQTVSETIQAALRNRQFLHHNGQTIVWILLRSLYQSISPASPDFDPRTIAYWMLDNEAKQLRTKVINRAYQGIQHLIDAQIENMILTRKLRPNVLKEPRSLEPFHIYELEDKECSPEQALETFLQQQCARYQIPLEEFQQKNAVKIGRIIKETMKLIDVMTTPQFTINAEVVVEQQAKQEKQVEQQVENTTQIETNCEVNGAFTLNQEKLHDKLSLGFLKKGQSTKYENFRFKTPVKVPSLIISANLNPFVELVPTRRLKPISNLLVQISNGIYRFQACSAFDARQYHQLIQEKNSKGKKSKIKYALIGADGHVLSSTRNLSTAEKEALAASGRVNMMTTYAAFLNGQIKDPVMLSKLIKKYQWTEANYRSIAGEIQQMHVSMHPTQFNNPIVYELCGWTE